MKYSSMFITAYDKDGILHKATGPRATKTLLDLIADIHREIGYDICPNKWVVEVIYESFISLETKEPLMRSDVYILDLIDWMRGSRGIEYCNKAIELPLSKILFQDIPALLKYAQACARTDIYSKVLEFNERLENEPISSS